MNRFKYDNNRRNIEKCPCGLPNKTKGGSYRFAAVKGSDNSGKCFSCGKFFYNSEEAPPIFEPDTNYNYVPSQMVREMLIDTRRTENPLIDYFNSYFEKDIIEKVFHSYWVGHDMTDNSIAFPYIDAYNNVRRIQHMKFKFDGVKCSRNKYFHKWDTIENTYNKSSFGEHLILEFPDKEVCFVESQRAALFLACADPTRLYLATGSKGHLQDYLFNPLKGRVVTLIPDADGVLDWDKRGKELEQIFPTIDFAIEDACALSIDKIGPNGDIEDLLTFKK
tara:strand:- start:676 stop:1509 length:834 start_codon:yes stop_codon:yes gene_type:complete